MERYGKCSIIIVFSLIWLVVSVMRIPDKTGPAKELGPDGSWVLSLGAMWQQGKISGRDFLFTYGPVSQVLAWLGQRAHRGPSAYDSLPLILLFFHAACVVLFAVFMYWVHRLGWRYTFFIYFTATVLNLFSEPTSFRVLVLMLCAAGLARTVSAGNAGRRRGWALVCGFLCILAQGITVELGVYAFLITVSTFLLLYLMGDKRAVTEGLVLALGLFVLGNLIVGFAIRPAFSYHRYAIEMLRGYTYGMGSDWALGPWPTFILALAGAYALLTGVHLSRSSEAFDCALLLGMLVCSAVSLKSALIRSDLGHITQGLSPAIVLFLMLGFRWPLPGAMKALWMGLFAALLIAWPWAGASAFLHLKSVMDGTSSLRLKFQQVLSASSKAGNVIPNEVRAAFRADLRTPVLAFPYENCIGVALQRPLVAPVLLAINAGTTALQNYYVDSLERHASNIDVVYGVDRIGSSPIDSVQSITRAPIIFEYLWRRYELRPDWQPGAGFYALNKKRQPKELRVREIRFHSGSIGGGGTEARLDQGAACNVVRLDLRIRYPAASVLGRPARLEVVFSQNGNTVQQSSLVPIEVYRTFSTVISLAKPDRFIEIFGPSPPPGRAWDKVRFMPHSPDWLGWLPDSVEIVSIKCID